MIANEKGIISGVEVSVIKKISDERGSIRKVYKVRPAPHTAVRGRINEIYFSTVAPDVVKAWHCHKKMTLRYACIAGEVLVVLVDLREESNTFGYVNSFRLSPLQSVPSHDRLVEIPPGVWNGFKSRVPDQPATIVNCPDLAHDPDEIIRVHPDNFPVKFDWGDYKIAG